MTRDEFLKQLRRGLGSMPPAARDEIIADYTAHFDAAAEDGRDEAEVAAALGSPDRLARELRLEAGIRRWQETRSPSTAFAAVVAMIGLGAIDIIVLLPLLLAVTGVMIAFYAVVIAIFVAGATIVVGGPFSGFPGGWLTAIPAGIGVMAAGVALGALLLILTIWLINGLMWFGRLHYRVLQPAIDNNG